MTTIETIYEAVELSDPHNPDPELVQRAEALMLAHAETTCPSWCTDHATGIRESLPIGGYEHTREFDYEGRGWVSLSRWCNAGTGECEPDGIRLHDMRDPMLTPAEARGLAAILLEAADVLEATATA
jgi:hypothetical protein